eukprot:scaffold157157_cov15-Tisochrysis_lutea.AAC.4
MAGITGTKTTYTASHRLHTATPHLVHLQPSSEHPHLLSSVRPPNTGCVSLAKELDEGFPELLLATSFCCERAWCVSV